jgi:Xaa-Pro aminopeptidase
MSAVERRQRVRVALEKRGWDGLVATPSANLAYLAGIADERTERLMCLGVPVNGPSWIVCPAFEADRLSSEAPEIEIVPWGETDEPFELAANRLTGRGEGIWAVEPSTAYHDAVRLAEVTAGIDWVDGAELLEPLRRSKDAEEIAALGRAIAAAWEVYDRVVPDLSAGVSEREVADRLAEEFRQRGYEPWSLIQFGPGSAVPHGQPGERDLERGQAVLIDWGGWKDGFTADLTRSFWWDEGVVPTDEAPEEYREVHDLVRRAQRAALDRAAPGVSCGDVDRAARDEITAAGYGEFFLHRLGHGLGREIHEPPYLVAGSERPLAPGDVVTFEPGVYLEGRFGVRWEDNVLVTDDGIEVLSLRSGSEA